MATNGKLRVFFDADVLLSAAAPRSRQSASFILLQLAELTLLEGLCCPFVIEQAQRNCRKFLSKVPEIEAEFLRLQQAALAAVPDPPSDRLRALAHVAHDKDLPVLAAAVDSGCRYLVTRNVRHYPSRVANLEVVEPGRLVRRIRSHIALL